MPGKWGGGNCILGELEAQDVSDTSVEAMGDQLQELFRHRNRLDAEIQRRLHRFDKAKGYSTDGVLTTRAWLRWKCHLSASEATERVEVARRLGGLEITASAFAEGAITFRHVALIARTSREIGERWEPHAEDILVTAAREVDPWRLQVATEHLKHCLAPDGSLADANRNYSRRQVHLSQTMDGMFRLDGQLDAEGGALLKTALDALMPPQSIRGGLAAGPRRADALVEMARRQLDSGTLPNRAGQKPHLLLSADIATLSKEPGSPAAELEWSQPVPAETARRIACDCCVTTVGEGDAHRVTRVIPGWMRRKLAVRDGGCRWAGCDMPAPWTDAHHVVHWADGGPRELSNLLLLCRRHHRMVHEGGWRLVGAGDEFLQAIPP